MEYRPGSRSTCDDSVYRNFSNFEKASKNIVLLTFQNIELLYLTNDSDRVRQIQLYLLPLQKSATGFELGQLLLQHVSKSCKYFGALTHTIYINTHLSSYNETIDTDRIVQVSNAIIDDIIALSNNIATRQDFDSNLFIIRKLVSNLCLLYLNHIDVYGVDPITTLLGRSRGVVDISNFNIQETFPTFSEIEIALFFICNSILIEDVCKRDPANLQKIHASIHASVFPNVNASLSYFNCKALPNSKALTLLILDCINSWVIYISVAENGSDQRYTENDDCQQLVTALLSQLGIRSQNAQELESEMEVLNKTFTVLTEIMETYPRIVAKHKQSLASNLFAKDGFGSLFMEKIISSHELSEEYSSEIENFVNLLIAYLNLAIIYISRNLYEPEVYQILDVILGLTNFRGNPILEERVSEQLLSFWEEFVNVYIDDSDNLETMLREKKVFDQFVETRNSLLLSVSAIYWQKIRYFANSPPEFVQYRLQVSELFILLYSLLNTSIYSTLCKNVQDKLIECQNSFSRNLLLDLEASLYLIYKVTDDLTFYDDDSTKELTPFINQFFSHQLVETIERYSTSDTDEINITLLNLLSAIPFFFKSDLGLKYLSPTFNFLFSIILNPGKRRLSLIGSKTVLKICQDSKEKLVEFLPTLELILLEMIKNVEIDFVIRERMVNSFISITQSLKDPVRMGENIFKILNQINLQADIVMMNPLSIVPASVPKTEKQINEKIEEYAVSLLSCINEIGKASQLPEDVEDYYTAAQSAQTDEYWTQDPLGIKTSILNVTALLSLKYEPLAQHTIATEKSCKILKNGLNEPINGPFRFELPVIFNYLIAKINKCNLPSIAFIFNLIETIVISNGAKLTAQNMDELIEKFFVEKKQLFESEVDLITTAISMFSTILERFPSLLVGLPVFQSEILDFALRGLKSHESFLIRATAKFWTNLIVLKRGKANDQEIVQNIMIHKLSLGSEKSLGYTLVDNAIVSFIDNPRSHLEYFYQLFRNLIGKYPLHFKNWLRLILIEVFVNTQNQKFRSRFTIQYVDQLVSKLMLTRGHRQANDVLKEFWLECNNLVDYKTV